MTFSFNGTQANVTLTGSQTVAIPLPATGQTLYTVKKQQLTGGVDNFATITAGKVGYLIGIYGTATASISVDICNEAAETLFSMPIPNGSFNSLHFGGVPIAKYTAGQHIKIVGPVTAYISLVYIEVDA